MTVAVPALTVLYGSYVKLKYVMFAQTLGKDSRTNTDTTEAERELIINP